jgi:hypothetical protein
MMFQRSKTEPARPTASKERKTFSLANGLMKEGGQDQLGLEKMQKERTLTQLSL